MKSPPILLILISIISIVNSIEIIELENIENPYNFIYPAYIGKDEEERQFLVDLTKQNTYLFKKDKITESIDDDEFETNLEINNLQIKEFEFELRKDFLEKQNSESNIYGIIGLGTINGKND